VHRWSELAEAVAATAATSRKTRLLADYLASLDPAGLRTACIFLSGRAFPETDQRSTGLGWAAISAVVAAVAGTGPGALGEAYDSSSDLGQAVFDVLTRAGHRDDPERSPSVTDVADAFAEIERATGAAAKAAVFRALLERADPLSVKYIVKVLTGELRIGLREGLVEAAIAAAFDRSLDAVRWAGMLTGDVGEVAVLAAEDRLAEARLTLFRPLKFMLASPAEDAAEILARLGPTVWVEDKYDGIRAQLHRADGVVRLYSRDLHDVSTQFPEIIAGAADGGWSGILDGELLAFRDGQVLPFLSLQGRLGRKAPSAAVLAQVPVIFVAFDLLALGRAPGKDGDGARRLERPPVAGPGRSQAGAVVEPLLSRPLAERRSLLEGLGLRLVESGGVFALSNLASVSSAAELESVFLAARARRNEGLMVKDPQSGYSPGRRGMGWLKMKKALATIDCVVVGVEVGHGKRHGVLSDYTFAVRDEATGNLVTIGKAYSGLTDLEIQEMTRWFEAHTIRQYGRYRAVEPTVVVEVAFDVIMRSNRHASGFALRFPRIANLRTDKPVDQIDTLTTVRRLYEGLQHGAEHLVTAAARSAERA
jgi:DNA ligase-1